SHRLGATNHARLLMRYSVLSLTWNAITGHKSWTPTWRDATPRTTYDVVIIGGGGHGLATAYYLAKEHGITNVAVLEKSWIGSGNAGRNTTIIRSNYLLSGKPSETSGRQNSIVNKSRQERLFCNVTVAASAQRLGKEGRNFQMVASCSKMS